jgi:hypothetical protein
MDADLQRVRQILGRAPATLSALLLGLPPAMTRGNEGGETWSAFEVVAHLANTERVDWIPRLRMILEHGESREFERVDRTAFRRAGEGKELAEVLAEFARLRTANLACLESLNLTEQDLEVRGRHPAFGPVTAGQLLSTWAAHDLTHLHQISRILAYPLREAVGPWKAYLGVLHCNGHGT